MRDLTGKVAWITGAGTGIGEAAARALIAAGMHVVLSGRRREPLVALAAQDQFRSVTVPRGRILHRIELAAELLDALSRSSNQQVIASPLKLITLPR